MIRIDITQEDIDKSEPMLEEKNPLGFALKRVFPNSTIHVGLCNIQIDNLVLKMSPEVVDYIEKFDIERVAEPISLEMNIEIK
jgi:hypothetical protein